MQNNNTHGLENTEVWTLIESNHRVFALFCPPCVVGHLYSFDAHPIWLRSEGQNVKHHLRLEFQRKWEYFAPKTPERVVKSFRRWTNTLRQVPMSIISPCWYACCCCKPTCQGPGFHCSPSTADQSLSVDCLQRLFLQGRQCGSVTKAYSRTVFW